MSILKSLHTSELHEDNAVWRKADNGSYFIGSPKTIKYTYLDPVSREHFERNATDNPDLHLHNSGQWSLEHIAPKQEDIRLPSGAYRAVERNFVDYLIPTNLREDTIIPLNGIQGRITEDIKTFIGKKDVYERLGITNKRGLLLYGPQGTGKTTVIRRVIKELDINNILVVFTKTALEDSMLAKLAEDDRLKIIIIEEITEYISHVGGKAAFLEFLDGENALDNTIIIATTNYPEKLEPNLVDRPSRFDCLYRVDLPTAEDRKTMLEHYLGRQVTDKEVDLTNDYSLAHLKEVALQVLVYNQTLEDSVKRMAIRKEATRTGDFSKRAGRTQAGFMGAYEDAEDDSVL